MHRASTHGDLLEPGIVTWDKTELAIETVFANAGNSIISDRRAKSGARRVSARHALRRLVL